MSDLVARSFAARLRERAAEVRHPTAPGIYLGVNLDPDEADAIADVLEAGKALGLACVGEESGFWVSFCPDGGPTSNWRGLGWKDYERTARVIERFRAALDRMAGQET